MIVLIVFQIVSPVPMQHPVTLVNQHHPRLWHEFFQIVTVQLIMKVSQILTVPLCV
jgi:hypothetical protein